MPLGFAVAAWLVRMENGEVACRFSALVTPQSTVLRLDQTPQAFVLSLPQPCKADCSDGVDWSVSHLPGVPANSYRAGPELVSSDS